MAEVMITRTTAPAPDKAQREALSWYLFTALRGVSDEDQRAWKRLWRRVQALEAGECMALHMTFPRNSRFHRKFFALLRLGFDAWTPEEVPHAGAPAEKQFDRFRRDVTILAGYFDRVFGVDGSMRLEARSISFASMDDAEFEQLYSAVADVLLQRVLVNYQGRAEVDRVVDEIVRMA